MERWVVAERLPPPAAARNLKSAPWPGARGPLPEGRVGRLVLGVPVGGGKFGPYIYPQGEVTGGIGGLPWATTGGRGRLVSVLLPALTRFVIPTDPVASSPLTPFLTLMGTPSLTRTLSLILTPTLSTVLTEKELSTPTLI